MYMSVKLKFKTNKIKFTQEETTTQKKASDEGGEEVVGMMGIK